MKPWQEYEPHQSLSWVQEQAEQKGELGKPGRWEDLFQPPHTFTVNQRGSDSGNIIFLLLSWHQILSFFLLTILRNVVCHQEKT